MKLAVLGPGGVGGVAPDGAVDGSAPGGDPAWDGDAARSAPALRSDERA